MKGKGTLSFFESVVDSLVRRTESLETPKGFGVVVLESVSYSIPKIVWKGREGLRYKQLYFKR